MKLSMKNLLPGPTAICLVNSTTLAKVACLKLVALWVWPVWVKRVNCARFRTLVELLSGWMIRRHGRVEQSCILKTTSEHQLVVKTQRYTWNCRPPEISSQGSTRFHETSFVIFWCVLNVRLFVNFSLWTSPRPFLWTFESHSRAANALTINAVQVFVMDLFIVSNLCSHCMQIYSTVLLALSIWVQVSVFACCGCVCPFSCLN